MQLKKTFMFSSQTLQVSYDLGFRGFDAPQVTKIVLNGKASVEISEKII